MPSPDPPADPKKAAGPPWEVIHGDGTVEPLDAPPEGPPEHPAGKAKHAKHKPAEEPAKPEEPAAT